MTGLLNLTANIALIMAGPTVDTNPEIHIDATHRIETQMQYVDQSRSLSHDFQGVDLDANLLDRVSRTA